MAHFNVQKSEEKFSNSAPALNTNRFCTASFQNTGPGVILNQASDPAIIYTTRDICLLSASRTVATFNRSYDEYSALCLSSRSREKEDPELTVSKSTAYLSKNPEFASGAEQSFPVKHSEAPNVRASKLPEQFPAASCHLL